MLGDKPSKDKKNETSLVYKIKLGVIGSAATITVFSIMATGGFIGWQLNNAFASSPATQLTASHDTTTSTTVK